MAFTGNIETSIRKSSYFQYMPRYLSLGSWILGILNRFARKRMGNLKELTSDLQKVNEYLYELSPEQTASISKTLLRRLKTLASFDTKIPHDIQNRFPDFAESIRIGKQNAKLAKDILRKIDLTKDLDLKPSELSKLPKERIDKVLDYSSEKHAFLFEKYATQEDREEIEEWENADLGVRYE